MTRTLAPDEPAVTGLERSFSEVLVGVLDVDEVSVDGHFFDDLGADSMLMARFCARVRKRADLPSVLMRDVYAHPTVRGLAARSAGGQPAGGGVLRGAGRCSGRRRGVGRRPLLRRSRRRLDAHGAVLCPRPQAVGSAVGIDERRLPLPDDQQSGGIGESVRIGPCRGDDFCSGCNGSETAGCGTSRHDRPDGYCPLPPVRSAAVLVFRRLRLPHRSGDHVVVRLGLGRVGLPEIYGRAVVSAGAMFLGVCLLPILAKWVLIGRWAPGRIRIWSLAYVRFWIVKTLVRSNPLLLVAGGRSHTSGSSPLYGLYLRALGARIGRDVVILSAHAGGHRPADHRRPHRDP